MNQLDGIKQFTTVVADAITKFNIDADKVNPRLA